MMLKCYNVWVVYFIKILELQYMPIPFNHSTHNAKPVCVYFYYSNYILLRVYFSLFVQKLEQDYN